jgi:amino acid transporter
MTEEVKPTIFVRRASGLVREVGPFTAMSLGLSHTIGGGINRLMIEASYNNPGANVPLAFAIVAIPVILTAICYTLLAVSMPRTGGDYIYITRALNPAIGFLSSWGFWFTEVLSLGVICFYDIATWGLCLIIAGSATGNLSWLTLGSQMASDVPTMLVGGFILLIIFAGLAYFGMRSYGWIVNTLLIIPAVGSFATVGLLAVAGSPVVAKPLWDATWGAGSWDKIVALAYANQANPAFPLVPFSMDATMTAGVAAIWAYIGFTAAAYIGGEVKSPSKSMVVAMILGTIAIIVYYVGCSALVYKAYGDFIPTYCFVHKNYLTELKAIIPFPPPRYLPTFTAALAPGNVALQMFVAITAAIWLMNDIPAFFVVCSRLIFSWSFDRFFPETFAAVDARFHTPYWANTLTIIGGAIAIILCYFLELGVAGAFVAAMDTTMLYQVLVSFGCLAAAVTPYVRRDVYEKGFKIEVGGIPVLTICGIVGFGLNFYFWLVAATWLSMRDMFTQAMWMMVGAIIFVGYYVYNTKKGIDVKSIYAEVPPA